ncbi:MAG: transglutaminase-like domain-containing protein [bacterium]
MVNLLRKIGIVLIELALIGGLLLYVYQKKNFENIGQMVTAIEQLATGSEASLTVKPQEAVFPVMENQVSRDFNWEYRGVKYSLKEKLFESVYKYYNLQPKAYFYEGEIKANWQDDYYAMFLKANANDDSIAKLALEIQALGKAHKLSDDQIVDLVLAFVQAIKYDDAKAKNILASIGSETVLYPYELLYQQSGVCSDKSLLAIAILRELGYGTAIFAYEQDNHMAIGVQCLKEYSTYGSGYCYSETTSVGNKIGIIPSFDSNSNKTVDAGDLAIFDASQGQQLKLQQLGQVTIYQKTTGKEYAGIIETKKISKEIDILKKNIANSLIDLQAQKKSISNEEKKLSDMKKTLENSNSSADVEKYNKMVGHFNDFLENYKKDVKKYNNSVSLYNKSTARYNVLIKQ